MPDIFLSYSRDDQPTARRFAEGFERAGFNVWWDATLSSGEAYDQVTEKALKSAAAVVVLWSKKSVESRWVRAEATIGDRNKTLVPVMIEACERPVMFELTHTADLSQWKGDFNDKAWLAYVADVRKFVDKGAPREAAVPAAQISPPGTGSGNAKRMGIAAIAALALLLVVAGVWWTRTDGDASQSTQTTRTGVSLAVLPFVNLSGDPQQEYFSDGLTEEVLNQLARIRNLRVTARSSSFAFKGKNEDVRVIGQELGVGNLLEGSVRKDGNKLRISTQLITARDGTNLWSQTYDRQMSDVFAVQEDIARDVAQALSIKLDVGEMSRAQGGTTNLDAYDKYIRAQALTGQWKWNEAAPYYRAAVALDPDFVRAWVGLASSYSNEVDEQERTRATERVEALAPESLWTQVLRAQQLEGQHKWQEAIATARAAMDAAPDSDSTARSEHALLIMKTGRVNESLNEWQRLVQLDPLGLGACSILAQALDAAGRSEKAQTEYERCRTLEGDHHNPDRDALTRLWSRKDAAPAAIRAQLTALLEGDTAARPLHQAMLDHLGDKAASVAALRDAFANPPGENHEWMTYVAIYADHYGDKDLALAAMRRNYVDWPRGAVHDLWRPYETNLRRDPRFKQIVRDLGLVDYWRTTGSWGDYCKPVGTDDFECQ